MNTSALVSLLQQSDLYKRVDISPEQLLVLLKGATSCFTYNKESMYFLLEGSPEPVRAIQMMVCGDGRFGYVLLEKK